MEERSAGDYLSIMRPALEQQMRERERVEQELQVARRIQQASLPKEVPTLEGWQISPYYQPAREVGGDFYDFYELEYGRVGLVVGDATGKDFRECPECELRHNGDLRSSDSQLCIAPAL